MLQQGGEQEGGSEVTGGEPTAHEREGHAPRDSAPRGSTLQDHERIVAGTGRRTPARSALTSSADRLSLDGDWHFRWAPSADAPLDFLGAPAPTGADWTTITLPAHWAMPGQPGPDGPLYTNVVYPIPVDPPRVPDANPTGDHRRSFDLPAGWPATGATHLRTEGIESWARIWLNGTVIGTRTGSRLTQDFDVTGLLRPTGNVLAIRVLQWSSGTYLEDQDQWWLAGIFRSITLLHRPDGGLEDVFLDGDLDENGHGLLHVDIEAGPVAWPITLSIEELGLEHIFASAADVAALALGTVSPWTAESPRRYRAQVTSAQESVEVTVGFRRIDVSDGVLRVNGRPIILRGVNRHEWDPRTGRVIDLEVAREELLAMKRANVDAVRTAHYPTDARWLDLADEIGMWVMVECDLETHGFEASGWERNPVDAPAWRDVLLDRIERTVERDKNHPSVILWSLGNESATGQNLAAMADWLHERDPRRPVHYEGDHAGRYTDVYARMYPALEEVDAWLSPSGPVAVAHHAASRITEAEAAVVRAKPLILIEYLHAMGTGPGGVQAYADHVESTERIAGGFVWEWKDHAVAVDAPDGTVAWRYGGDFGEVLHDGNFVLDGLNSAENGPHPGLHHWAESVAPVRGRWGSAAPGEVPSLQVESLRQFTTTEGLELAWRYEVDGRPIATGTAELGALAPAATHALPLPADLATALERPQAQGVSTLLLLEIRQSARTPWAPSGHVISTRQFALDVPRTDAEPSAPKCSEGVRERGHEAAPDAVRGGGAGGFEAADGRFRWTADGALADLGDLPLADLGIDLWRTPTDNDEGHGALDYEAADPRETRGAGGGARGPSSADRWRGRGLDRLVASTRSVRADGSSVIVQRRLAPAGGVLGVGTTVTWTPWFVESGPEQGWMLDCRIEVEAEGPWEGTWPRLGLHLALPVGPQNEGWHADWFGLGPHESWPDLRVATWMGRHRAALTDLQHPRVRPQASGHRSELRELAVHRPDGRTLEVRTIEGPMGFTIAPHSPLEQQVAHRDELPPQTAWHLHLDLAQHGVGTRSCGPDVRPRHQLRPGRFAATLRFRAGQGDVTGP